MAVTLHDPQCYGDESALDECSEDSTFYCDRTKIVHVTCSTGKY